jgi:hypothetical protein
MTKALNKAALLKALKPKTQSVTIEGFGEVGIAQLTVAEVDSLRATLKKDERDSKFAVRLVLASVVDDDGNRVFEEADLPELEASGSAAVDQLVKQTMQLNGFTPKAEAKN